MNATSENNNRDFKLQKVMLEDPNEIIKTLKNNTTTKLDSKTIITLSQQPLKSLTFQIDL